ncbi:MAG: PEP-CTERM sorting domain-containing protein [Pirellula sp.]
MKKSALLPFFIALLGIVTLGSSANAAVISIDLTGKTGDNAGAASGQLLDLGAFPSDATTVLKAASNKTLGGQAFTGLTLQGSGGIAVSGFTAFDKPLKFNPGDTIGAIGLTYDSGLSSPSFKNNFRTVGDFGPNSFLGFKDSLGRYGYIEVTWTASTNTFRMISAAYESTPGVSIQTPGGAVPEPASSAIVALLMGGATLRKWRKRNS